MAGTRQFNCQCEKYLFTVFLDPGNTLTSVRAIGALMYIITSLVHVFRSIRICDQLDNRFATPNILDCLDFKYVEYSFYDKFKFNVEGMPKNCIFKKAGRKNLIVTEICSDNYTADNDTE